MITRKSGWPLALACVLASLPTRRVAAEHPHAARWTMSQSFDKCTLTAIARDAGGNGGVTQPTQGKASTVAPEIGVPAPVGHGPETAPQSTPVAST